MFLKVRIYEISNETIAIVIVMNFHYLLRLKTMNWDILVCCFMIKTYGLGTWKIKGHVPPSFDRHICSLILYFREM